MKTATSTCSSSSEAPPKTAGDVRSLGANRAPRQPRSPAPHLWLRNTWGGATRKAKRKRPNLRAIEGPRKFWPRGSARVLRHAWLYAREHAILFTENDPTPRLVRVPNENPTRKTPQHYVVGGDQSAINPALEGTKARPLPAGVPVGETVTLRPVSQITPPAAGDEFSENEFTRLLRQDQGNDEFLATVSRTV